MSTSTVREFALWSFLVIFGAGPSPARPSDETSHVKVLCEQIERVSRNEVHFRVKIINTSDRPVFLTGINYESRPQPYPVFLEQWRTKEGWRSVTPCVDTSPPDVIELNPSAAITMDLVLKLPLSRICKQRNIQLEGRFRYRLDYFEDEKQARAYLKDLYSRGYRPALAGVGFSDPFEMPPPQ